MASNSWDAAAEAFRVSGYGAATIYEREPKSGRTTRDPNGIAVYDGKRISKVRTITTLTRKARLLGVELPLCR